MKNIKTTIDPSASLRTNSESRIRIAVGMSGGVDSSVSALLLKQQALRLSRSGSSSYDVVGLFMKLWHDPCGTGQNACCDEKALADAHVVAKKIGIPLYVVDVRKEFKDAVTDYFIDEYKNCRTPNPCVVCNKKIKFGWLLDFAKKIGCEKLATGHYVRIDNGCLFKGSDNLKDQSYFLYQLNQDQLSKIIFPVGDMTKAEVRKIAKEAGLPVHEKKESQEICFIEDDYRDFLRRNLDDLDIKPGEIVNSEGKIIGCHDGLINFTIGQAKGISQDRADKKQETKKLYVTGFDAEKNQLLAGRDEELLKSEFEIKNIHWISQNYKLGTKNNGLKGIKVKIRYKAEEIPCTIKSHNSKIIVHTSAPVRALTPGQSAVFYCGDEVLGGGMIQ